MHRTSVYFTFYVSGDRVLFCHSKAFDFFQLLNNPSGAIRIVFVFVADVI